MTTTLRRASRRKPDEFTSGEVATLLGVAPKMVNKWADDGMLPSFRLPVRKNVSTHRRFRKCDLIGFSERYGLPNPFADSADLPAPERCDTATALLLWRRHAQSRPREYGPPERVADRALSLAQSLGVKLEYLDLLAKGEL